MYEVRYINYLYAMAMFSDDPILWLLFSSRQRISNHFPLTTYMHGWRMPYGRCGRCHTNFARATPTFCPFIIIGKIIIGHTNFDLLVNHMFWPHQVWKPSSAHAYMFSGWVLCLYQWCHNIRFSQFQQFWRIL